MKIVESTQDRLRIAREKTSDFELLCLTICVNTLVIACFTALLGNPYLSIYFAFILSCAIGWIFIHLLLPRDRRDSYWLMVICSSVPYLGVAILSYVVATQLQVPQTVSLTFDKSQNLLTIKNSRYLFWRHTVKYPLNDVLEARLDTRSYFVSAGQGIAAATVVCLARRGRNGRVLKKDILAGAEASRDLVQRINHFLLTC